MHNNTRDSALLVAPDSHNPNIPSTVDILRPITTTLLPQPQPTHFTSTMETSPVSPQESTYVPSSPITSPIVSSPPSASSHTDSTPKFTIGQDEEGIGSNAIWAVMTVVVVLKFTSGVAATYLRFLPYIKKNYDYGVVIFLLTLNLITISSYRVDNVLKIAHVRFYILLQLDVAVESAFLRASSSFRIGQDRTSITPVSLNLKD
ncbi:hypothetical protein POM88_037701 [Heracleum sosnowskyi]|uniref:Uncharacterized protein n=1 Tax=Heracleum sosnowskyi TaxID=360622 RepID=A0AAD8HS03_9APIA|nr:hypothetical protein POM88_037701 [Heracleum sosnowskyi]